MKNIKSLILIALLAVATSASAQYTQSKANVEYMLKVEAGYLHNVGNYGTARTNSNGSTDVNDANSFDLRDHEEGVGLNVINGINISQDFFLGLGLGYSYCFPLYQGNQSLTADHIAQGFIDMDYRPIEADWAPMVGARIGGSFLINNDNYGSTISPYVEVYTGLNWFYDHALQQMDKNYHSFFAEVGIVFQHQTIFIPIRLGWRL